MSQKKVLFVWSICLLVLAGSTLAGPCPVGDLSGDCVVNVEDLQVFAEQWLDAGGCSGTDCANLDGINGVNFSDFALLAGNWSKAPVALVRIAAESDQSEPRFYNTQTSEEFTPVGSNYIRLDWDGDTAYHITFNASFYDAATAETALTQMEQDGYNIVRVFIDRGDLYHQQQGQYGMPGPVWTNTPELYQPCVDNFIDFLRRARNHNLYVIPVCLMWPHNVYYENIVANDIPANVESVNIIVLAQGAIDAKKLYLTKLVEAVKNVEPDGTLLSTVFSWELSNEINVNVQYKPFSMTSGTVTPADGGTYHMSDSYPDERQFCMDSGIIWWVNQLIEAVEAVDPNAMISLSVFTYQIVGKPGPCGVLPRNAADPRFPGRPWSLLTWSNLSYVDIHLYPTESSYSMDSDLASSEYSIWDFGAMPLLMGEFGAFKSVYPNIYNAANAMVAHRQNAFDRGFSGSLYWTWDTFSQTQLWHLLDEGGVINDALKPDN